MRGKTNSSKHGAVDHVKKLLARPETSVIIAVVFLGIIFSVFSDSFMSVYNIFNISRTAALYICIALGQVMALIVGGMNLSLGQIGGLTVVVSGYLMDVHGLPIWIAVVAGLAVGLSCVFLMNNYHDT